MAVIAPSLLKIDCLYYPKTSAFVKQYLMPKRQALAAPAVLIPDTQDYCFFIGLPQHSLGTAEVLLHFSHL